MKVTAKQKTELVRVTPSLAEEWLKKNVGNRPLSQLKVNELAEQLRRGEYITTHQGIAFDTSDILVDGQHRLSAIVKAGVPIWLNVSWNVSPEAFKVMDQGVKRKPSDILRENPRVAEVINTACRIVSSRSKATPKELEDMHNAIGDVVKKLVEHAPRNTPFYSSAQMRLAATVRILEGADVNYVMDLYRNLTLANFDDLPNIGKALMKQQTTQASTIKRDNYDTLARGMNVFDPDRKNMTRVAVKDPLVSLDVVRTVLNKALR